MLNIAAILITLTAVFSYINHRFVGLPTTIGVMVIALAMSLGLIGLGGFGYLSIEQGVESFVGGIDFYDVLMNGMLSLLLFAGALHIDLSALKHRAWAIGTLATVGVLASTFLVGGAAWLVFDLVGLELPLIYCLLFGALISPTDPIAVLGILKSANAPQDIEIKIVGESLFNDGVAVVIFTILLSIAVGGQEVTAGGIALLFVEEALGGALFGLVVGYITYRLTMSIDEYRVELMLTLALVFGGYALAMHWHLSGPIAMVVAGLMIGNHGRMFAMSDQTWRHVNLFWEVIDEVLNAVLFVLLGLEIVILTFTGQYLLAGLIMIPVVLLARWLCVGLPISVMRLAGSDIGRHAVKLLTWGGIRGGISIALALSLPQNEAREPILTATYVLVLFSILVQGLTIGKLVRATVCQPEN